MTSEPERLYACPKCGSTEVQLSFPVWVAANDIDNQHRWEFDAEASPVRDPRARRAHRSLTRGSP